MALHLGSTCHFLEPIGTYFIGSSNLVGIDVIKRWISARSSVHSACRRYVVRDNRGSTTSKLSMAGISNAGIFLLLPYGICFLLCIGHAKILAAGNNAIVHIVAHFRSPGLAPFCRNDNYAIRSRYTVNSS